MNGWSGVQKRDYALHIIFDFYSSLLSFGRRSQYVNGMSTAMSTGTDSLAVSSHEIAAIIQIISPQK